MDIYFLLLYNPSQNSGLAEVGRAISLLAIRELVLANEELNLLPDSGEAVCPRVVSFSLPQQVFWNLHAAFEVLVGLSGQYNGCFRHVTLTCHPGDVLLVSTWEPHGLRITIPGTVLLSVLFEPGFLGEEMLGELPWPTLFAALPSDRPRVTGDAMRQQALAVASEMRHEIEERQAGWHTALRLGLYRLLFLVGRTWAPPTTGLRRAALPVPHPARVAPALQLVQARGGRPVRVEEAAAACHMSPSQFAYDFRHSIGVSFAKYVQRRRLAHVAQLVVAGDHSLESIAEQLGFTDRSHLHHAFRRRYGCTPGQYRARSQLGAEMPL